MRKSARFFFSLFGLICVHSPLPDELCEWDKKSLRAFGESWSRWVRHFSPHFFLVFVPRVREKRWVEEESFGAGPPPAPLLDEEKSGEIFGIPFLVAQSTVNPYFFFFPPSLSHMGLSESFPPHSRCQNIIQQFSPPFAVTTYTHKGVQKKNSCQKLSRFGK